MPTLSVVCLSLTNAALPLGSRSNYNPNDLETRGRDWRGIYCWWRYWGGGDWTEVGFEKTTLCLDSPKINLDVSVHLQMHGWTKRSFNTLTDFRQNRSFRRFFNLILRAKIGLRSVRERKVAKPTSCKSPHSTHSPLCYSLNSDKRRGYKTFLRL